MIEAFSAVHSKYIETLFLAGLVNVGQHILREVKPRHYRRYANRAEYRQCYRHEF